MTILKSSTTGIKRAKVVLIGAPGVGKTSLVAQYVHSVFSEEHKSTLGVKVDRKTVDLDGQSVALLIWDMHGETDGLDVPANYLSGAAAALVVVDGTRPQTIDVALDLAARFSEASPGAQVLFVANKADLHVDWETIKSRHGAVRFHPTSAKSGEGVEELFLEIARSLG